MTKLENLVVSITFHYQQDRLYYLKKISSEFPDLSHRIKIFIITNTDNTGIHQEIRNLLNAYEIEIVVPTSLNHPYYLTWQHFSIFRDEFLCNKNVSHFLYLEDDIKVKKENIEYWLKAREDLRPYGLIPSFLRYEKVFGEQDFRSTDIVTQVDIRKMAKISLSPKYCYMCMPNPYQAMYLMDRELAEEHLFGSSYHPDFGFKGIRERAAQGLTFSNIPKGFTSRNLVGVDLENKVIDSGALIHHISENYANDPFTNFGKIKLQDLLKSKFSMSNMFYTAFKKKSR